MKMNSMKEMMVRLAEVESTGSPVLTCMVNLNQTHQQAADDIRQLAGEVGRGVVEHERKHFNKALEMISDYVLNTPLPEAAGAAIYARAGVSPFLYAMPVGIAFESSLVADELPHIYPLVETRDTYHRFVVVTLTAKEARIFETTAGAITNEIMTERPELRQKIGREWTRERYHNHESERKTKFIQNKIEIVEQLMAKKGHNHLIVAGSPKMVSQFTKALPPRLSDALIDSFDTNPKAGIDPIILESINAFVANEHQESLDRVKVLESAIMRRGLGVVGEYETRHALEHGYADVLIISQDYPDATAKEELVRLAIATNVDIETVKDSDTLNRLSGVGCLLRYRPSFGHASQPQPV